MITAREIFKNKPLIGLLAAYGLLQVSTLFIHSSFILFAYELCYLAALIVGAMWISKRIKENKELQGTGKMIWVFFVINLVLILTYVPLLILNSSINWHLNGENEADPMILLVFWPPIHFIIALLVIGATGIISNSLAKAS
jgi:hypothetical protein